MDLRMIWIPYDANRWDVTRAVAEIVHSKEFHPRKTDEYSVDRPINFKVVLNESKAGGVGNDGTGILTLPTEALSLKFLRWVKDTPLKVQGKKVKVYKFAPTKPYIAKTLEKTPYVNPDNEEKHEKLLFDLQDSLRVDAVQVGVFYRSKYPSKQTEPLVSRSFSVEWEQEYVKTSTAWLSFEYDEKLIKIALGNSMTEEYGSNIHISFSSIHKVALGYNPNPYICFDTLTPPVLEKVQFHRTLIGDKDVDFRKFRHRIGSLHPGHEVVAPYAHHLRIVLYSDPHFDIIKKFTEMCTTAGLTGGMLIHCRGPNNIEWDRCGFYEPKRMWRLSQELKKLPWPITFQFESLLRNGLLHSGDVEGLLSIVKLVNKDKGPEYTGDLLRTYHEALQVRSPRESPMQCFHKVQGHFAYRPPKLSRGEFRCCHVTFTPTRMILEGPYAVQSNRVIRQFYGYEDYFIRVDFRDEDRLQYRWSKEVDGATYLERRVGGILKTGFELGGRYFEFLAYSMSALREHSVWFVNPFYHPEFGPVSGDMIRNGLGQFDPGSDLLRWPSKFAARLSQAFTATDPSVTIQRDEWELVPDLGKDPYLFTDGVGTISKALGNRIWNKLCESRRGDYSNVVQPSAYQIRFLGFKGVVCIDEQLDNHPKGISMRLRPSMEKFIADIPVPEIEIAQSFEHPNTCYLNRPLIMLLEALGVRIEDFVELQERTVREARTIDHSSADFRSKLDKHGLGRPYRLSWILRHLEELDMELSTLPGRGRGYDTPFIRQVRQISMLSILRDIKHNARIDVPESHLLVGVADEGPAYEAEGMKNVYCLPEGHIYACIQESVDQPPMWLKGSCSISRSPVAHPGDVQRVRAIGPPPEDKLCFFRNLKNCVILPSQGQRSLASCLGGGDVDGDLFAVICYDPLLPNVVDEPAAYPADKPDPLDRDCTVDDICDFVVEYIKSDVLGLLSDRLLIIADQSQEGIRDKDCIDLAKLCSQAVDFPKAGVPVNIEGDALPKTLIRCKPDWHAAEVVSPRNTDYYESNRALGVMYRQIKLDDAGMDDLDPNHKIQPLTDPISERLRASVGEYLYDFVPELGGTPEIKTIFARYFDELRYICATHTITNAPGVRLLEAEVVAGTILAKCSQKRYRKDRMYRMRLHAGSIVRDVQNAFIEDMKEASKDQLVLCLEKAWTAWAFSHELGNKDGANSFGLIALGLIFDCLDRLGGIADDMSDDSATLVNDTDDDGMDEY